MLKIWQSAGKSYAYILGVYLGDGCVVIRSPKNVNFQLGTIDKDFADKTANALLELTGITPTNKEFKVKKSKKPVNFVRCACAELGFHLKKVTKNKSIIPKFVKSWDDELKKAFVSGLMDSEGWVAEDRRLATARRFFMGFGCCDTWFDDFKIIVESLGIQTGKERQEQTKGGKTMRRFNIKMQSWIDSGCYFNIARKQDRVNAFANHEPYSTRSRYPRRLSPETICRSCTA